MSTVTTSYATAACPACVAGVPVAAPPEPETERARIMLSLPTIHCAACISKVERGLAAIPGVHEARVNLTLKRVAIDAEPGLSAEQMIDAVTGLGYEAHEMDASQLATTEADRAGRDLLMRLAVAGFASMNVMLLSVSVWSGAADATRDLFHWISAAITLPVIAFSAQPFFRNALAALRHGRLNMDVPISLAIVLAVVTSLWETMLSGAHAYFDAALALTFFLLAGRYLDHRTRAAARSAAETLAALEIPRAVLVQNGVAKEVAVSALATGDLVLVRPGGRIAVDGTIEEGRSELDRSILTGETLPVAVAPGQQVSAGEINLTGPLYIRASAVGANTSLQRMAELVAVAESGRSHYTSLADKAVGLYAPGVHILAALSFAGWYLWTGDLRVALNIAAAVLIITCPCALGLAVPAVTTAASGRLFRRGLLIKHETALERLAEADTVVFDKTGTLTLNQCQLTNPEAIPERLQPVVLALAQGSDHPLARAIATALAGLGVRPAELGDLSEQPGCGVEAHWQGKLVQLGRADWVGAGPVAATASYFAITGAEPLALICTDVMRPGAAAAIAGLKARGLEVILLSGDHPASVAEMAATLGITDWSAALTPQDKSERIRALTEAGRRVLMVGDGLNDTIALAEAHVSISPASALEAARVASDIVLLGRDLAPIVTAVATARQARARIRENFGIASVYNLVAVPLAIAGLATPLVAALAMSASSLTVSLNALRVR